MQLLGTTLRRRWLLALAAAAALAFTGAPELAGQSVTTGSLSGLVAAQEDGAALPGAIINAVHQPTGTRYNTVTQADGRYRIVGVRVGGPYTVSASMDGFRTQEQTDLFVSLGEDLFVSFELVLEAVEETVTVVGASDPLINPSKTGAASNVSEVVIETLPTIGRGLEDFARTNPFFTVTSINEDPNSISVAGRSSRYNNIQIDGAVNNDLFGLADTGTPGGQAATQPISLDAIQEIQLVLAPFDVRQGGFSGGGVNAITRSGTNRYEGSVYYFTRDDSLVGDIEEKGEFGTFDEDEYGFRIGGPISRDKIFFFANGEISERQTPTGWSLDGSTGQQFADGDLTAEAQRFREILIDRYGFDPGGFGENVRDTPSDKFFGRLDFNLTDSHGLTLRHNYVDAENDINRPDGFAYEWPSESYFFVNETNSTVAQLNSVFSADKFNELRVSYQTIKDRRSGRDGLTFPWIEIENLPGGHEFEAGTEPFSTRNALDQDIFELTNDFTWIFGNHTLTLGTHNEFFTFDNLFIQNAFGAYEFVGLDGLDSGVARRFNYTLVNPGQAETQKFDVTQLGFYVGDQWRARSNLTLTYGLRVDIPYFPDEPSRNEFTEATYDLRTDTIPDGQELWSPRVGFNWDIGGDGKSQLRGGTGIFAGRTPYVWISNNYARTGIEQTFITRFNVPFNPDPFNQPSDLSGASIGEFNLIDPDFEFPQVWRVNVAYDRELPWWGLVGSVEVIYADSLKEIDYKDVNLVQTGTLPFDGRPVFGRVDNGVIGAYLITNTNEGEATNVAVKLEKPYRNGWWGYVSYVYGDSKVVNDGTSSRAVSNFQFTEAIDPNDVPVSTSDFEVEHRFNAGVSYTTDWGGSRWPTTFAAFYNHQSGRPYSWIYGFQSPSGGINGDGYFDNDLFYVPSGPDDVVITNGTWEELDRFISSDPCLDSNRGRIAPRNCSQAPWYHSLDLRFAQDIPISKSKLQLTLDLANFMNLLDEDSGLLRFVNFSTVEPVSYAGVSADGKPIYGLNSVVRNPGSQYEIHNIESRWRAKLGVRWSF